MDVIIADDHQIVRDGIRVLLMKHDDIVIKAEASNGEDLLKIVGTLQPDIIIMDISMPKINGIEATKIISEKYPQINIIIFSSHTEGENVIKALEAGAKAIIPKNTIREELIEAINAVSEGNEFISKYIPYSAFTDHIKKNKTIEEAKNILTEREIELTKLISEGKSNKEIAETLFISQRTVEKHKSNILKKLEMSSVVDLVKYAIKNKLTDI